MLDFGTVEKLSMENTVYVVMIEWATTDDAGTDYYLYKNYDGALDKFNELIEDECNPDISWVADAFDENGKIKDGFELDCNTDNKHSGDCDLFWRISATYDYRYIVIEVEGYKCVAVKLDNFLPYTVGETIAPFDKDRIYPLQGLVTEFAFKRF